MDETREVCRIIHGRVFQSCLENVPEYFEHSARALLAGLSFTTSSIDPEAVLFWTRYLTEVPGYVYTEEERIAFQKKLKDHLKQKSEDTGVDAASLIGKSAVDGLPKRPPRLLYLRDFDSIETTPKYRQLTFRSRYRIAVIKFLIAAYHTEIGRVIMNFVIRCEKFLAFYFPFRAFMKFGIKKAIVDMFSESPKDNTVPKPNAEYNKPPPHETWYGKILAVLW